jgi:hypothetical protein
MLNTRNLTTLFLILALAIPKWVHAQDLANKNGVLQQSQHTLLPKAPSTPAEPVQANSKLGLSSDSISISTHEKFATFLAGEDFSSTLLLENFRPDLPITFNPRLILSQGEVALDPVTVPPHSSTTVDITAILKQRGLQDTRGTVAIRFDFKSYGPGAAVVQMRDDTHHVFLNSYAQSAEEYWSGTSYDAVVWAPQEETEGFIALTNASDDTHAVRVAFVIKGRSEHQPEIQIPARQTRMVSIHDLLDRSRKSGAGIHIEYDQAAGEKYPGAILVEGQLFNKRTGFAKNIHFMDKALPPTGTLRTHFLMLGRQPAGDNFPSDMSFRSVAAVRNIDSVAVAITPTVKFLRNDTVQSVNLPVRLVRPDESTLIDFQEEQKAGHLPPDFTQGSVELTPDTGRTSIVGELFNFSQSGGYVVGPSFTSYPNRATSSIWRIDGSFQTTVMIENTAAENDKVAVHLYSERGQYSKTFDVPAGRLIKINLRDLQQNNIADDHGNLLVDTSGVMSLIGGHNARSKLSYDKIVHSTDQSDYVGLPPNPCDYVTSIGMYVDTSSGSQPFPVMKEYDWSMSGPQDEGAWGSSSSNSISQLSQDANGNDWVTFNPPDNGQSYSITLSPPFPQEAVEFCVACSGGDVNVIPVSLNVRISTTFWGPPVTVTNDVCFWGSLACSSGTPTCRTGIGISFFPSCPNYVKANYLVINGSCLGVHLTSAATGPGPCD